MKASDSGKLLRRSNPEIERAYAEVNFNLTWQPWREWITPGAPRRRRSIFFPHCLVPVHFWDRKQSSSNGIKARWVKRYFFRSGALQRCHSTFARI